MAVRRSDGADRSSSASADPTIPPSHAKTKCSTEVARCVWEGRNHHNLRHKVGVGGTKLFTMSLLTQVAGRMISTYPVRWPVTPEVAGSSPVRPAKGKLSYAATSRRFVFLGGALENCRLAKRLTRSLMPRAETCANPRPKRCRVARFRPYVPRIERTARALKSERSVRVCGWFGGET